MRFFDSTLMVISTQILGMGAMFISSLLISRTFGGAGKGLVALYLNVPAVLFAISNLAMGTSSQYFISRRVGKLRTHFTNALLFPMSLACVVAAGFIITYRYWQPHLNNIPLEEMLIALLILPLLVLFEPCTQILIALGKLAQRSICILTQSYCALAGVIVMIVMPNTSPILALWGYIFGWIVGASICLSFVSRAAGSPAQPSWELFKQTFKYGRWIYFSNVLYQILTRVDFFMVFAIQRAGAAGVYSVATGLTSPLLLIPQSTQAIFFPRTSALSDEEARRSTPFYFRQIIIFMFAASLGLVVIGKPVLALFGKEFTAGYYPLLILVCGTIIKGMSGILTVHLLGRGKTYVMFYSTVLSLAVSVMMNLLLVPVYGMTGAAFSTATAYASENLLLLALFRKLAKGNLSELYSFRKSDFVAVWHASVDLLSRLRIIVRDGKAR